ncbi:Carboxymuconolactone decarboxylase family protein [Novipirellula galeiformis]|uniref:Carboxymuconolactone decarboxylase family protein n=1 Tax=Novipirellula galeiformis TaxID=2528004 RepID=A0A5C6CG32_9BACT|nr:peroxidase-related enzyme [Novipirellula galeiformis]TWU21669.1 Carboxymuconolactone decarboxylase family protein [Novipirellula galeiformis]
MQRFPLRQEADAPQEVGQVYRDFQHGMGFPEVPNFIRVQGTSPGMLASTWALAKHILLEGSLPRSIKELIFVAIAVERQCKYCKDAHTACCRILGVEDSTIRAVMEGLSEELPDRIRVIIQFAVKCATGPHELTDEDFASLRRQDLDNEQILEVIATASMAVYAITIADATLLDTDAMFVQA